MAKALLFLSFLFLASAAAASNFAPVESVFHLTKNTNRNQVHYGVEVDSDCQPDGRKPLTPYWLMREQGDGITEKLRFWEQPGYGVRQPEAVNETETGHRFEFVIRGVPEKQLEMTVLAEEGQCVAHAVTDIDGIPAVLNRIDIEVSGWANVHRVEIFGTAVDDGRAVSEITHQD